MTRTTEGNINVNSILKARVILEACPPTISDRSKTYAILRQSFSSYSSFQTISVPDIQDSGEFHRDRTRVPNDEFGAWLQDLTGKPLNLYKVVPSCTRPEWEEWLSRVEKLGCRDITLVGPDSSDKCYKEGTLQVGEGARIAGEKNFHCGGIIIPTRRRQFVPRPATVDEADRIVKKVREFGITFFTTQIIYESEWTCCLLLDLMRQLQPIEIPRIFLTFSPFVCPKDLTFAKKFLGVYIPADVEYVLLSGKNMREISIYCLLRVWERISAFAREIGFPREQLGINAEYIDSRNPQNVDAAFRLAEKFNQLLDQD